MSLGLYSLGLPSLGLMYGQPRTNYGFSLFDFKPNWASPVREVFQWKTDIITSQKGLEQRRSLRNIPRRTFTFDLLLSGRNSFELENRLYGYPDQTWAMPVWTDAGVLSANASADALEIFLDTHELGFKLGGYVVFYESAAKFEFARITSIADNKIEITEGLFYAWGAGSTVYPLIFTKAQAEQSQSFFTSGVLESNISMDVLPVDSYNNLPDVAPTAEYLGHEVLEYTNDQHHNWVDDVTQEVKPGFTVADNALATPVRYQFGKHTKTVMNYRWFLNGRERIAFFRGFINRRMGMLNPFWFVRQIDDFELQASAGASSNIITVKGDSFGLWLGLGKGRDHIAIRLPTQTLYKRITEFNIDGSNTQLVLDGSLGADIAPNTVVKMSHLMFCRLAADQVTLDWHTNEFAESITFFEQIIL